MRLLVRHRLDYSFPPGRPSVIVRGSAAGQRRPDPSLRAPREGPVMLTPAEELGLSGMHLASRVRKALSGLPEAELLDMMRQIQAESQRRHLVYLRDGQLDTVPVMPCPMTAMPEQLRYIHFVTLTIQNALKRL